MSVRQSATAADGFRVFVEILKRNNNEPLSLTNIIGNIVHGSSKLNKPTPC